MKLPRFALGGIAVVVTGSALFAQQPGGAGFGRMINPGGVTNAQGGVSFGRMIYPGTGGPVVARTYRPGGPAYVAPPGVSHPLNHSRSIVVPYPVFYGGYYYGYDAPPAPNGQGSYYDSSGAGQEPPVIIINQSFSPDTINPSFQDYSNVPLPPPTLRRNDNGPPVQNSAQPNDQVDQSSVYLIALKDHTIYAAIGYWVEGETLHYITPENVHNRVALDQVDRAFTKQLNDERHIDMRLPEDQQ